MKERPILFSGPMVRAILAGTKTQTRRVCKPAESAALAFVVGPFDCQELGRGFFGDEEGEVQFQCPYGQPGDRLYVKETFFAWGRWETRFSAKKGRDEWHFIDMTLECDKEYRYAASMAGDNGPRQRGGVTPQWWKRPAIFMPRAASRILLEIVAVRVERLNDISEADANAEGCDEPARDQDWWQCRRWYRSLWESINGPGSWAANPFVWVLEFNRVTP